MPNILWSLLLLILSQSIVQAENLSKKNQLIRLATTTSTENSGLLKYLLPSFEKKTGYKIHVIAVGTGKALRMGKDGDVDVLLVHAPDAEQQFMAHHYGINRTAVMHNDFVIVGAKNDPAKVSEANNINVALQHIATQKSRFISRGDDSGTHKKERTLWRQAGVNPIGKWHIEAGQGMGKVLQMAAEMDAYTLADRGTWLTYQDQSSLHIVFAGDQQLFNPYSLITVNSARYPDINDQGAKALTAWITSTETQQKIADFRLHQQTLFIPDALKQNVYKQDAFWQHTTLVKGKSPRVTSLLH